MRKDCKSLDLGGLTPLARSCERGGAKRGSKSGGKCRDSDQPAGGA